MAGTFTCIIHGYRDEYKTLFGKSQWKKLLERNRRRWEDIKPKINLKYDVRW